MVLTDKLLKELGHSDTFVFSFVLFSLPALLKIFKELTTVGQQVIETKKKNKLFPAGLEPTTFRV